jgi:polyisoprenoid-binding protein YceI
MRLTAFVLFVVAVFYHSIHAQIFTTNAGVVKFSSNAPLELIQAQSNKLSAAIDGANRSFAFNLPIASFEGFNSPLQKEHFNENYMETKKYPNGVFKGRIIESVDLKTNGTYTVRAKGVLNIHGVESERIIKATIIVNNGSIKITSKFKVPLAEHKITIPKVVFQKIAEEIDVDVTATLLKKV